MKISDIIIEEMNKNKELFGIPENETAKVVKSEKLFMGENDNQWRKANGQYSK